MFLFVPMILFYIKYRFRIKLIAISPIFIDKIKKYPKYFKISEDLEDAEGDDMKIDIYFLEK